MGSPETIASKPEGCKGVHKIITLTCELSFNQRTNIYHIQRPHC